MLPANHPSLCLKSAPLVVLLAALSWPGRCPAADTEENPHVWKPQINSVAVFKNGLGFFVRQGEVALRDGWCHSEHVPPAAFGTLAIYAIDEGRLVDLVGSGPGETIDFDGRDAPDDQAARRARLEAARGLKLQLQYRHKGQSRSAAGTLISVGPDFAVLEEADQSFAVPVGGITRMQVLDLPLRIHVAQGVTGEEGEKPKPQKDDGKLDRTTLGMAYLRQGITWIPDYTLKILDAETAELTLRGTLVNEAEDLIHTDVHLVVGVPHFVHTEHLAPIAVGQVIRTIGAGLAQNVPQQVMSQLANNAAIVTNFKATGEADVIDRPVDDGRGNLQAALGNLPQLEGAAATDYTVYTKRDLTLHRGEKAILTLLTRKIRYTHAYRWSPPEAMKHYLVLENDTGSAWTTGPCLAVDGQRPLSEDLIRYTPQGDRFELPVTTAINLAHEKTEREIDRQLKAHSPNDHVYFDLVTIEGEIKLRNFDAKAIDLAITNPVPGKPTVAEGGTISLDPDRLKLLERQGTIRWQLKLAPGEQKTLQYKYERYVPSN